MRRFRPRIGAIIRTHFPDEIRTNPPLLADRLTRLQRLIDVLSSVRSIRAIVIALPDLPTNRGIALKHFRTARLFFGDAKDVTGRMIDCARGERIDVIVDLSDQSHLDRTKPEIISKIIRHHLATGSDYTGPEGFTINALPRVINRDALEKIHRACARWPYYHHCARGLRSSRFSSGRPTIPSVDPAWVDRHARFPLEMKERACLHVLDQTMRENGTILSNLSTFLRLMHIIGRYAPRDDAARSSVLEIGSGHYGGAGIFFYLLGARHVTTVDVESSSKVVGAKAAILAQTLEQYRTTLFPMLFPDRIDLIGNNIDAILNKRFSRRFSQLCPCDAKRLSVPSNSIRLSFSWAVLEHVDDPEGVIREQFRVLKPGGTAIHSIGLLDHNHMEAKPLEFLKYPRGEFEIGHTYCNKCRAGDFVKAFKNAGFIVRKTVIDLKTKIPTTIRKGLHKDFRDYSDRDLSILGMTVVARKR